VGFVVILQGGYHLEKVTTPEHCPFHRRHNKSIANCLGVDAERNSGRVHREKSSHESDRPGESLPVITLDQQIHPPKLLDVAEGLDYLHTNNITHGNLTGVGVFQGCFGPH